MPAINYPGARQGTSRGTTGSRASASPTRSARTARRCSRRATRSSPTRSAPARSRSRTIRAGAAYAYYALERHQPQQPRGGRRGGHERRRLPVLAQLQSGDPGNPGIPVQQRLEPSLHAPNTWEIIAGVEHELLPAFALGVNYTYRKFTRLHLWRLDSERSHLRPEHRDDPDVGQLSAVRATDGHDAGRHLLQRAGLHDQIRRRSPLDLVHNYGFSERPSLFEHGGRASRPSCTVRYQTGGTPVLHLDCRGYDGARGLPRRRSNSTRRATISD